MTIEELKKIIEEQELVICKLKIELQDLQIIELKREIKNISIAECEKCAASYGEMCDDHYYEDKPGM